VGLAVIAEDFGDPAAQVEALVSNAKQQRAAVAADVTAGELGLNSATSKAWKRKLENGTIWHGEAPLLF